MKSKQKTLMLISGKIKTSSTTVITTKSLHSITLSTKKLLANLKIESAGIPITEFVGLRSKMYSYVKDNEQTARTAKGIKKTSNYKRYQT